MVTRYDQRFLDLASRLNRESAAAVVPMVRGLFPVNSVLDCGCAQGGWLRVWLDHGVTDLLGIDGDYGDRERLLIDRDRFLAADLGQPIELCRRFDLAMCLEVAEHLPESAAGVLVATLTRHASVVLFAAAPPGQGGEGHLNEQPYEYWRDRFLAQKFVLYDPLRSLLRGNVKVQPWYRHNLLMFVDEGFARHLPEAVRRWRVPDEAPVPDVAPLSYRVRRRLVRLIPPGLQGVASRWASWLR